MIPSGFSSKALRGEAAQCWAGTRRTGWRGLHGLTLGKRALHAMTIALLAQIAPDAWAQGCPEIDQDSMLRHASRQWLDQLTQAPSVQMQQAEGSWALVAPQNQ